MMNPLPVVLADMRRSRAGVAAVVLLIALAVALGVAVSAQERALRKGSAQAADAFDLVVGAPGSQTQLVLTTVYLQPAALDLLDGSVLAALQAEPGAAYISPVAFGDFYKGHPLVGVTADFVSRGGRLAPVEGRLFARSGEAVAGIDAAVAVGTAFEPVHGHHAAAEGGEGDEDHVHHGVHYTVVGRMPRTGTPWDRAIVVPVEAVWQVHGLGTGHADHEDHAVHEEQDEHEEHDHAAAGRVEVHDHEHGHDHGDEHADARIGPPWDAEHLAGVPAVVVKPKTVADAYRLRGKYRTPQSMALFPAEVLVDLYATLGDARDVLAAISVGTQALVIGAILLAVFASMGQRRRQLAVLRALGAARAYVFLATWCHVSLMVAAGTLLGLGLGAAAAYGLSSLFRARTGVFLPVGLAGPEWLMAAAVIIVGMGLAAIPAMAAYRQPVSAALRA